MILSKMSLDKAVPAKFWRPSGADVGHTSERGLRSPVAPVLIRLMFHCVICLGWPTSGVGVGRRTYDRTAA